MRKRESQDNGDSKRHEQNTTNPKMNGNNGMKTANNKEVNARWQLAHKNLFYIL